MSDELKNKEQVENKEEAVQEAKEEASSHKTSGHHHHSGHHHSHHHGHHRHGRHRRSSRWKRKIKRFFRRNKHKMINIIACTLAVALMIGFAFTRDKDGQNDTPASSGATLTQSAVSIKSSLYEGEILLVDDAISTYMAKSNTLSAHDVYGNYKGYERRLDVGVPVEYAYEVTGLPANVFVKDGVLEVSEYRDYSNALEFPVVASSHTIELYHLKVGTKYYYRLTLNLNNNSVVGTNGEFTTKALPRFLKIDGIKNVRDFGGWKTVNDKTVKQGLLYRGTELDGAVESGYRLTPQGLSDMTQTLGIRFDMDLRSPSVNTNRVDALGSNIPHKYYNAQMYSDALKDEHKETMRKIFGDLANKNNYPIYMHCTYGRDRTGTVCYLLDGLLGVSREDAFKEYELSAFVDSFANTEEFRNLDAKVASLSGNTFQQKVENYLLSVGVTSAEINSIREIFLEK